jgi:hypothetical protein
VVLPVDQASNSDVNNLSSSNSDISLSGDLQDLTRSIEVAEAEPLQSNEGNDSNGSVVVGYVKPHFRVVIIWSVNPELHGYSPEMFIYSVLPSIWSQKQIAQLKRVTSIYYPSVPHSKTVKEEQIHLVIMCMVLLLQSELVLTVPLQLN